MTSHNIRKIIFYTLGFIPLIITPASLEAKTLFTDDFNTGSASPEWKSIRCCQWVSDGWYYTQTTSDLDSLALVHDKDTSWKDYMLSLKAQFVEGSVGHINIILRSNGFNRGPYVGEGSAYQLEFWSSQWSPPKGQIALTRSIKGHEGVELFKTNDYSLPLDGPPLDLNIILNGPEISLTVNNDHIFTIIDPAPLAYGGIGVHTIWTQAAKIDDVVVSTINENSPKASATPISPSSIQLVWNKDTNAKALRIQRKTGTCEATTAWATRMDLGRNKTTVEDTGLKANTAYAYRLAYYYGGKTFSEYSACVSATTNLARTPNMPKSLVARSDSDTQVTLTWSDLSTNERGFDIFRKDDQNDWAKLASTGANTPIYRDNTATGNATTTTYAYHVEACNTAGCSQMNPNVAVVPFKPTALQATPGTTVQLQWVDASSNESGFTILRKNGACGNALPWTTVATVGADKTTYGDTAVIGKTRYAYQVQAHTATAQPIARGYSANSECVSVVTP
jgi:hypothetical protein